MSGNQNIVITGIAAISSVGLTVQQTCASIRAGISRFQEHPYYFPKLPNPSFIEPELAISACVPAIDPLLDNPERLMKLFIPSLTCLFSKTHLTRKQLQAGALLVALPQKDKIVNSWSLESRFIPELCKRTGLNTFKINKINQTGHTGMLLLVEEAVSMINSGEIEFCIIGGVDSYLMGDRMEYLDECWRIKSARNPDGFIPGEAACVFLLEKANTAKSQNRIQLAAISHCGIGKESQNITSDKHSSGTGLSEAIAKVVNQRDKKINIKWVICDLNGESYRGFEWGLVRTRLNEFLSDINTVSHPADCIGDIGAATGGMLIANAIHAFNRGYNISDDALLWTASDDGLRAALCVSKCIN